MKRMLSMILAVALVASCLFVLPVSATETAFTDTFVASEHSFADNATVLNRNYTLGSISYTYDAETQTATWDGADERGASAKASAFMDLSGLRLNSEATGSATVEMNVSIDLYNTKGEEKPFYMGANDEENGWITQNGTWHALSFSAYVDGAFKKGQDQEYSGLLTYANITSTNEKDTNGKDTTFDTTKRTLDSVNIYYPRKGEGATGQQWNSSTKIPIKLEITKGTDGFTIKQYAKLDGENWVASGTSRMDQTVTGNKFTGFGFFTGCNNMNSINRFKYTFSDAKITEYAPTVAEIEDLSDNSYITTGNFSVGFTLPTGVTSAAAYLNDTKLGDLTATAGWHTGQVDLSKVTALGGGRKTLTIRGTANGESFSASTTLFVEGESIGSFDEDLFTNPVATNYYKNGQIMNNKELLDRSVSNVVAYSYDNSANTATLVDTYGSGNPVYMYMPEVGFNDAEEAELEIDMTVQIKPYGDKFPVYDNDSCKLEWANFRFVPMVDYTQKNTTVKDGNDARYAAGIYFIPQGRNYQTTPTVTAKGTNGEKTVTVTEGMEIPYKILITKKDGKVRFTQKYTIDKVEYADADENGWNSVIWDVNDGDLSGLRLTMNQGGTWNLETCGLKWVLSNASMKQTVNGAQLRDLSTGFYTQNDSIPVDFSLPQDYKSAVISVNGTPVASFASGSTKAGSYRSILNAANLGAIGNVTVTLQGTTATGTFEKTTTLNIAAATDMAKKQYEVTTDNCVKKVENGKDVKEEWTFGTIELGTHLDKFSADVADFYKMKLTTDSVYDSSRNPNGPFNSQYVLEWSADVDFTDVMPKLDYIFGTYTYSDGYWAKDTLDRQFNLPQGAYNLKLRLINSNFTTGDGNTQNFDVLVYADDVCIGKKTIESDNKMNDNVNYIRFQLAAQRSYNGKYQSDGSEGKLGENKYWTGTISITNPKFCKYSLVSLQSAVVDTGVATVTFDRDMDETSLSNIKLTKADGTEIDTINTLSNDKKTVTLTAKVAIPADVKVVLGAGTKEADYNFTGNINGNDTTVTRLGDTITVPVTVNMNNAVSALEAVDLQIWKSGQSAIVKAVVNTTTDQGAKLIVAAYTGTAENPTLVECTTADITSADTALNRVVKTVQFEEDFDYVKVFLWDNFSGMTPLYTSQSTL